MTFETEFEQTCHTCENFDVGLGENLCYNDRPECVHGYGCVEYELSKRVLSRVRPEILEFAVAMERILIRNDNLRGCINMSEADLIGCVRALLHNFERPNDGSRKTIQHEVVDIANFCMSMFQNAKTNRLNDGICCTCKKYRPLTPTSMHTPNDPCGICGECLTTTNTLKDDLAREHFTGGI